MYRKSIPERIVIDMYEFESISAANIALMTLGCILFIVIPVIIWIIWIKAKKERISTILIGAATFLLFALIIEKPIQNALIFPTCMGLPDHALARFINARPILWSILVGFFPGLFEETGRFVAFKTVLKKRTNRETSVSYGLGHGGFEVILILGMNFVNYVIYAVMINSGLYKTAVIDPIMQAAPDQLEAALAIPNQLAAFSIATLGISIFERVFAVLFHTGASLLVFYACKDKKKAWLYPLAIVLHTILDGMIGLNMKGIITLSDWGLEMIIMAIGTLTFFASYFILYKNDSDTTALTKNTPLTRSGKDFKRK